MLKKSAFITILICSTIVLIIAPLIWFILTFEKSDRPVQRSDYPVARRNDSIIENFYGTLVADPYRWLENSDSEETREFIRKQNEVSRPYLEDNPTWRLFNEKFRKLWNYPKYDTPMKRGDFYFTFGNSGLQNQNIIYKQKTLTSIPEVFLDPNVLSADGTIALRDQSFSHDGSLMAYSLSELDSDWVKIKIRNVTSHLDFPDVLENVKFTTMKWTMDNKGFFYSQFPAVNNETGNLQTLLNFNQKLYYHRIGEPQQSDILVVEFLENPTWKMYAEISDCGRYLFITVLYNSRNLVYYVDLQKNGEIRGILNLIPIVTELEANYEYITNTGPDIIFRTNKNAQNYRLISVNLNEPAEGNWATLIKEHPRNVLDWAHCVHNDKLVVSYMEDVKSVLQVHALANGRFIRKFPLELGQIVSFSGDKKYSEIFYKFESFLTPGTIYKYDFAQPEKPPSILYEIKLNLDGFDKNDFVVEQIFYSSRDYTKIPMFIVQRNLSAGEVQKPKPCMLFGYGGFNFSVLPSFSVIMLMFMHAFDGVLAFPSIRGGGEFGEKWYHSGRLLQKQNVFDDFQSAASYLISKKYTNSSKLVIFGGSNGGLLVGACINQRPDLFGAAVINVGVLDMLRYHKFTIGHAWMSDFGNPDEEIHFKNLIKFSPLHNIRSPNSSYEQYPSTLVLTGDHDDRVSSLHSLKFVAQLHHVIRNNTYQNNPILLRVYSKSGHGLGKPTTKKIEEASDILTFIYKAVHLDIKIKYTSK